MNRDLQTVISEKISAVKKQLSELFFAESAEEATISALLSRYHELLDESWDAQKLTFPPGYKHGRYQEELEDPKDLLYVTTKREFIPVTYWHLADPSLYFEHQFLKTYIILYTEYKALGDDGLKTLYNGLVSGRIPLKTPDEILTARAESNQPV